MASILVETEVRAPAATVWAALARVGEAHRVFAPVLSGCRMQGDATRVATFADGKEVTERILSIDPDRMRIAYTVLSAGFEHHGASMRVIHQIDATCRFEWTTDLSPDAAAPRVEALMRAGSDALRRTFEA